MQWRLLSGVSITTPVHLNDGSIDFVGIQATGKSSFYKYVFDTHLRINLDMLRTRHREQVLLQACIEAKQRFVIDNTNPTLEERARYIEIARAGGFTVTGYYFRSSIEEAVRRNAERLAGERVPDRAILGTFKKLQLPTFEEGFDQLYYVYIADSGKFIVQDWVDGL
jgi:predicted kinase